MSHGLVGRHPDPLVRVPPQRRHCTAARPPGPRESRAPPRHGIGSTARRKRPAVAGTRYNRQALPADRSGIQQRHLVQQTFDPTAKTAARSPHQISGRVQSSLIALQGRLQLWCKCTSWLSSSSRHAAKTSCGALIARAVEPSQNAIALLQREPQMDCSRYVHTCWGLFQLKKRTPKNQLESGLDRQHQLSVRWLVTPHWPALKPKHAAPAAGRTRGAIPWRF